MRGRPLNGPFALPRAFAPRAERANVSVTGLTSRYVSNSGESMSATTPSDMLSEINEVNLSYLLLAQRLLREDRPAGMFRMGLSEQLADVLSRLTAAQTARLAASSQLLCRFRFDEHAILSALAEKGKAAQVHAAMLMAGQSVEQAG
jgi:flagellar transcriptional activator FlhD